MVPMHFVAGRAAAGLLSLASVIPLWFGFWWAILGILTLGQTPDASIPDGDPCCSHPDTWGEVVLGGVGGTLLLVGCGALVYIAFRLAAFALQGVSPSRRQTRRVVLAASYIAVILALTLVA